MKRIPSRPLPVAVALAMALSFGGALAQTGAPGASTGSGSSSSGSSSMTGGGAAPAAQPGTGTRNTETRKDDKLARADRKFMQDAAESGMYEVQVAQLAQTKAASPEVKSFAGMLEKEHASANNELVEMANSKKVELPGAPGFTKRREVTSLGKRTGADFDQHFVREVGIKDHEKDIKNFEKASTSVKDPQLKAWIDKTLPHLRDHLAQAQKLPQAGDASMMGNKGASPMKKSAG